MSFLALNSMALEYPDRRPFIFGCVMAGSSEIFSLWIPRSAALALGIFTARIVDYMWLGRFETTLTAWLMKTVMLMVIFAALLLGLRGIQYWYISGN